MLKDIIRREFIKVKVDAPDWKCAIHEGVLPLFENGLVSEHYEKAILENFKKHGTYMVIAPGIVLSHARPEDGVIKQAMSVLNLKSPINFGHETNDPVSLVITLAAQDNTSHLNALSELMDILINEESLNILLNSDDEEELARILL